MNETPAHVVNHPGDKRTMCGRKVRDTVQIVARKHVQMHIDGRNMPVCESCAAAMQTDV